MDQPGRTWRSKPGRHVVRDDELRLLPEPTDALARGARRDGSESSGPALAVMGAPARARTLLGVQRRTGNRTVGRLLASTTLQRCGGETHEGCACAGASVDADVRPSVQRSVVVQRDPAPPERPADRQATPAPDPWAGPTTPVAAGGGAAGTGGGAGATSPAGAAAGQSGRVITAERVGAAEFQRATGLPLDSLPDGVLIRDLGAMSSAVRSAPADMLPPGIAPEPATRDIASATAGATVASTSPVSFVPANATGIMWVQGHLSIFAKVNGTLTIRGFRGNLAYYTGEMLPGAAGRWFSQKLNIGVPGGFVNDLAFTKMHGKQTAIYVPVDADTATAFRDELNATQYNEPYKYSAPRPTAEPGGREWRMRQFLIARGGEAMAVQCGVNCITLPVKQIESAIGMHPQVDTEGGRLDVVTGRTGEGPVDPHEKGRASHLREFMKNPDLSQAKPGATRISLTPGGTVALGVVRIGGGVFMVYGGIASAVRLWQAVGTDDFPQVAAEEAASWTGGIGGAQLGTAIATGIGETVLYVAGGELGVLFVAGSFGLALGLGYLGAKAGVALVRAVFDAPKALLWGTTTFLDGFMTANEVIGGAVHATLIDVMLRPVMVMRERLNPGNWALRTLPPDAARAVRNLGMAAWATLGRLSPDELKAVAGKSFAQLGVAPAVAADVSRSFVPAGILITSSDILARTPADFVQYLLKTKSLEFVQDPEVLADQQINPKGHKVDEAYLNVHLLPMIATRARINPNNWDLRAVHPGAGAGDVRAVGMTYWNRLRALKQDDFGAASGRTLAQLGVTAEALRKAAQAMARPRTPGMHVVPGEAVPADVLAEYTQQLLEMTPDAFARHLQEFSGLQYLSDPDAVANAARNWVSTGYQPW